MSDLSPIELNKLIARRFLQVWTMNGEALARDLAAPDILFSYGTFQEPARGIALYRQVVAETLDSFPDLTISADEILAEGDKVTVRWTYHATHQKNVLFGVPPTGKEVEVSGITIYRIVNAQVVEEYGVADTLSLMLQLGAVPTAAGELELRNE
jgi:steroid delta-isomerase-like uncharacterized protein